MHVHFQRFLWVCLGTWAFGAGAQEPGSLPILHLPDGKIAAVYQGNWQNTLKPCRDLPPPVATSNPHVELQRPWKVDVEGRYPGWYPGVDVKHLAAAYLGCEQNLPLVLRAWDLTIERYLMTDGGVRPMTMAGNPHSIVPETTLDGSVVFYPLRTTANIDLLLLGDMIYRFSRDPAWLTSNLPALRRAAAFLEGWIDDQGLLHSDSYDLDQVYREIDGVAQASAFLAFSRLADLESAVGNNDASRHFRVVAQQLAQAAETHFWDDGLGYYVEHLAYNNIAQSKHPGTAASASSELDSAHPAAKAIDGVVGLGIDAFGVGTGTAGHHEWVAKHETDGAWLQVNLGRKVAIERVILLNRTDPGTQPGERFAAGDLEFSDGSPRVAVTFNRLDVSRAVASFPTRTVEWVRFRGTRMQGEGGQNAGLAEFMIMPSGNPYRKISHGMTDSSMAMVAFHVASDARAAIVWRRFQEIEDAFYRVQDLRAPTWISSRAGSYGPGDLNRRAPYKDCVAMARTWRYDALMRRRMKDGKGLLRTIGYANALYDRPSGGGAGWFAERYGLGRFQPGDEAQATIPAYAEYPAVYNSTIVQQCLLGVDVDVLGRVVIDPCVPEDWHRQGFDHEGLGVLQNHRLAVRHEWDRLEGWMVGPDSQRGLRVRIPPGLPPEAVSVQVNGKKVDHRTSQGLVEFSLELSGRNRSVFVVGKDL